MKAKHEEVFKVSKIFIPMNVHEISLVRLFKHGFETFLFTITQNLIKSE